MKRQYSDEQYTNSFHCIIITRAVFVTIQKEMEEYAQLEAMKATSSLAAGGATAYVNVIDEVTSIIHSLIMILVYIWIVLWLIQ